jgi:cytochrome c553
MSNRSSAYFGSAVHLPAALRRGGDMVWSVAGFVVAMSLAMGAGAAARADDERVQFNRDVRPILADACFHCHGPDAKTRKADVRLDDERAATEGDHAVIAPGKPDESELIARILSTDEAEVMPPPETNKKLTDEQKEILRRWIAQGAGYQKHWSFEAITEPSVPAGGQTQQQPIDAFLEQRITAAGLTAQPAAGRETQIRRVAFTLTGLPPSLEEIEAFLGDTSERAYESMVERYLASPRYGEEMARHWLDVARYADTHGLHLDNERQMWLYRDWVVSAFNRNQPFDQFTLWQVAGDQLPSPTPEQLVATGFNRCNVTTSEGGALDAEFAYRYAVERTTAVAQAWLGLTAGCAVCHDHKYDPISSKEFYSMYAFFNNAADPAMDGNINTTPPFYKAPTPTQQAILDAAGKVERESRGWLDVVAAQMSYTDPAVGDSPGPQPVRDELLDETLPLGGSGRSSSRNAVEWIQDAPFGTPSGRRALRQAQAAHYDDSIQFGLRPVIVPQQAVLEVWVRVDRLETPQKIGLSLHGAGSLEWTRVEGGMARGGATVPEIKAGEWTQLKIPAADLNLQPGARLNGISLSQNGGIACWDGIALTGQADPATDPRTSFSAWRKLQAKNVPPETPNELHGLFRDEGGPALTEDEQRRLRAFYLAMVARPQDPALQAARTAWETARTARVVTEESAAGTFIYNDSATPRESFVMLRGAYDKPGEKVEPDVPAILPPIRREDPSRRLNRADLAQWLVAPENPLTARVTVNRFWQQVFGTGLVKTSFDFGSQGTPPSHPELLDWLAWQFRASGWDVKALMKQMLMSEAFRRSSQNTPAIQLADPANRLYARGLRVRLDAEQLRDNVLYVSGLMQTKIGGRGVNPYQPPNIWEPVGYQDSNTRFYLQDHGEDLYRRSLYVFLKRTAPPPFMSNFDAPNREQVCTARERSNTPLQALQLMNDVQHFEAARALAERVLAEGGSTEDRLQRLYRIVLSRRPQSGELEQLRKALDAQHALYQAEPTLAAEAVRVGESAPRQVADEVTTAAWTLVANLVLNLDETVNRN